MNILAGLLIIALAVVNLIDMKRYEDLKKEKDYAEKRATSHLRKIMKLNYTLNQAEKEHKNYMLIEDVKRTINSDQTIW